MPDYTEGSLIKLLRTFMVLVDPSLVRGFLRDLFGRETYKLSRLLRYYSEFLSNYYRIGSCFSGDSNE